MNGCKAGASFCPHVYFCEEKCPVEIISVVRFSEGSKLAFIFTKNDSGKVNGVDAERGISFIDVGMKYQAPRVFYFLKDNNKLEIDVEESKKLQGEKFLITWKVLHMRGYEMFDSQRNEVMQSISEAVRSWQLYGLKPQSIEKIEDILVDFSCSDWR